MTERLHFHFSLSCVGEGNGNPLQCSCLENPRDGGAWWATAYEIAESGMTEATEHAGRAGVKQKPAAAAAKLLQSCPTLCDPTDEGPLSLGFSRQEHWSGLPFPSPTHESEK